MVAVKPSIEFLELLRDLLMGLSFTRRVEADFENLKIIAYKMPAQGIIRVDIREA